MKVKDQLHTRVAWRDPSGAKDHGKWYPGTEAAEVALAACRTRWPDTHFWMQFRHFKVNEDGHHMIGDPAWR